MPLNARITEYQANWLRERAGREFAGNLSEAVRQALTEARTLRMMIAEHEELRREHPGYRLPRAPGGESTLTSAVLSGFLALPSAVWEPGDVAE